MNKRSELISKLLVEVSYKEETEFISKLKLQNGKHLIGRMIYLCSPKSITPNKEEASVIIAGELHDDWVSKNVYPIRKDNIASKILNDYKTFKGLIKHFKNTNRKKTDNWYKTANEFNSKMTKNAYDVRTKDSSYQTKLEKQYGVRMTVEDDKFYNDNCFGSYNATCQPTISKKWVKQTKRIADRNISENKKSNECKKILEDEKASRSLMYNEIVASELEENNADHDFLLSHLTSGCDNNISIRSYPQTRNKTQAALQKDKSESGIPEFPQIPIRTSRKVFDEKIMRCTIQCLADHNISRNDAVGIILKTANIIFGQKWSRYSQLDDRYNDESESEEENEEKSENYGKRHRKIYNKDLTYVFPSNRTLDRYLEDASYLNLHMVADYLLNKDEGDVVTVGLDDTTKAAGHKSFDVKTDHITFQGQSKSRMTMTTGYIENLSHSGADGATAYEFKLKILSVLADCSVEDIKSEIDFWMTDRAGDCSTLLETLDIESSKILKCSAHLILGIDHAIDKVFRETEQKIGVHKLLELSAGHKAFSSSSTAIHTLGQIAISKLLSPSHASHSISLFNEYKGWMNEQGIDHNGFKGFQANRFGRIAEIAKEFTARRQSIIDFFDAIVDSNANKLVMAVATYIQNDWFILCSELYSEMGTFIIFPIMHLLGIDKKDKQGKSSKWTDVREFFKIKLSEIKKMKTEIDTRTGRGRLMVALYTEILETLERQLGEMAFFSSAIDQDSTVDWTMNPKLDRAPVTNLGCESEFASLDNMLKKTGGTTSVQTLSRKNTVSTNAYLVDSGFLDLTKEEKRNRWEWARHSNEVKEVRKMEADFLATVKQAKLLVLRKKEQLKKRKGEKLLEILGKCKCHGGPITPDEISILDKLSEKELLLEISYLRLTVAPNIRQRRRVTLPTGKYKYENLSILELKTSIQNAVKPESDLRNDINQLLKSVF